MVFTARQQSILALVQTHQPIAISDIKSHLTEQISTQTLNRDLAVLVAENALEKIGKGRATVYQISSYYKLFIPIVDSYFDNDLDQRDGATQFNLGVIELLQSVSVPLRPARVGARRGATERT